MITVASGGYHQQIIRVRWCGPSGSLRARAPLSSSLCAQFPIPSSHSPDTSSSLGTASKPLVDFEPAKPAHFLAPPSVLRAPCFTESQNLISYALLLGSYLDCCPRYWSPFHPYTRPGSLQRWHDWSEGHNNQGAHCASFTGGPVDSTFRLTSIVVRRLFGHGCLLHCFSKQLHQL